MFYIFKNDALHLHKILHGKKPPQIFECVPCHVLSKLPSTSLIEPLSILLLFAISAIMLTGRRRSSSRQNSIKHLRSLLIPSLVRVFLCFNVHTTDGYSMSMSYPIETFIGLTIFVKY